ncbi:ABC transporter permease [Thermoproteota archaeon]
MAQIGFELYWRRFSRNKLAVTGLVIILFFSVVAIFTDFLAPYNPIETGIGERFEPPSVKHLMGTDDLGKDIFSGVVYGARVSIMVGFFTSLTSSLFGIIIGTLSGYFGGRVDEILIKITEMNQIIPTFFLATLMASIFGSSIWNVIMVLSLATWPRTARLCRAEFLSLREKEFVLAAKAGGANSYDIIVKEILPNAIPPLIVNATLVTGSAILLEAGISFLGLGDVSSPSWGLILHNTQPLMRYGWWLTFFPGASISLLVLAINLVGDGLNDALNPRIKKR